MGSRLWIVPALGLLLAACDSPVPATDDALAQDRPPSTEQRNAELLRQHAEIWKLMALSPEATAELNALVVAVSTQMATNRHEHPEAFAKASDVQRAQGELTHADYMASHRRRFEALGISAPTRAELLAAAEFVWTALHDPAVPAEKRQVAQTIQSMMKAMNGPPPCCDDNIFQRAAR
jgi:hypothetical protein